MYFLLFIKLFMVAALVKLLLATEKPLLCAGIYAVIGLTLRLLFGYPFVPTVVASAISFALAFGYFWLLDKFQESGLFWVIMILGFFVILA